MKYRLAARTASRSRRPLAAAALVLSWAVAGGCDKGKPDATAAPPGGTAAGTAGAAHVVAVFDPQRMGNTLGWVTEINKQREAVNADVTREVRSFHDALDKAVEEQRKKVIAQFRLNADQIDKLSRGGADLDKLPLTKEARDEYVRAVDRAMGARQESVQVANNAIGRWNQEVQQVYIESARPAVRRAAQAGGYPVVFATQQVFFSDTSVDITDKVIDDLQKSPPPKTFPATPRMNFPPVQLSELTKPATQSVTAPAGAAPATQPGPR